jgi:hypothetical protein
MTTSEDRPSFVDGAAIDRLVDGDLTENERRELLLRLENDPEGWRRCALAFLEDQAFRRALAGSPSASTAREPAMALPSGSPPEKPWLRRVSIAATLLASTFAAGYATGEILKAVTRVEVAKVTPGKAVEAGAWPPSGEIREVGSFQLVDSSGGESPTRRFPILSGPGLNDQWLRNQPPSVPDYVRARWERQGYQVEERRNLVSVELEDGRRVAIPVDEVEVDYVGQKPL